MADTKEKRRKGNKGASAKGATDSMFSHVPKNRKGGVLVTEDELKAAFDFFDVNGTGKITLSNLKTRLSAFYSKMPMREYRFLMNNENELSLEDLKELLMHNEVTNFDPVAEAFKVYDPDGTGFVDTEVLRTIFGNLGFGDISDEDVAVLVETADIDADGKISLEDFRKMVYKPSTGIDDGTRPDGFTGEE